MALTAEEIGLLVGECAPLVEGARVDNVYQDGEYSLYLTLHAPGRPGLILLFCSRPRVVRFHLVPKRPEAPAAPPSFCELARKVLRGSQVDRLRQVSGDRVVELVTSRPGDGGRRESASLVLELMGARAQLALVGSARTLLGSLHPLRRGTEEVPVGAPYRFPPTRSQPPQLKSLGGNPWRYLPVSGLPDGTEPAPLSFALAEHYGRIELEQVFREKRDALVVRTRRELEKLKELQKKVREDLERTSQGVVHREHGELLKGVLGKIRKGMSEVELENYFQPGLPRIKVPLDPALAPRENMERFFRRYQKLQRAVPILQARLARIEEEAARAEERLELAQSAATPGDLPPEPAAPAIRPARVRGPRQTAALGPRRYVSSDGLEILVGRSARQNDELTLHQARGNDVFLHVAGKPGAHVIVRADPGKPVPLESLLDAAQLALLYSLPERQRKAPGVSAGGDVDYTQVKNVRKPRGSKPGLVLLSTHKSLRVRLEAERLARLQDTAREASAD